MANTDFKTPEQEIAGEEFQWRIAYLQEIRTDIRELRSYIDSKYNELRGYIDSKYNELKDYFDSNYNDLRVEIKEVRNIVESKYGILDTKIDNLRKEMHKQLYWIIGTMIAIAGVIIAVFKL